MKHASSCMVPFVAAGLLLTASRASQAQQTEGGPGKPGSAAFAPEVGKAAPDFALPGATRYGLLRNPVRLSDFRGQTVVVAFFPKARTKG